jgi:hypothetical protein
MNDVRAALDCSIWQPDSPPRDLKRPERPLDECAPMLPTEALSKRSRFFPIKPKVIAALPDEWMTADDIAKRAGVELRAVMATIRFLVDEGFADRKKIRQKLSHYRASAALQERRAADAVRG